MPTTPRAASADTFGICQWFHLDDDRLLDASIAALDRLGVRHLRTGISWADWHRPGGPAWYDRMMGALAASGLEVLLSVWHTPPSLSLDPALDRCSVPPRTPKDYADFLDVVIDRHGDAFTALEIWNEPNNPYKWDPSYDPDHACFAELVANAGHWVRHRGKPAVFGGMVHLDYDFVRRMRRFGALDHVDVMGVHAFPHMWEPFATDWEHPSHWFGWEHRCEEIAEHAQLPVWITETGVATYRKDHDMVAREQLQAESLLQAVQAPAERVYWYCLFDLDPARTAIEEDNGGPREHAEYHLGLIRHTPQHRVSGYEKDAFLALEAALAQ
jgi:CDP-paratose 2-epimerase